MCGKLSFISVHCSGLLHPGRTKNGVSRGMAQFSELKIVMPLYVVGVYTFRDCGDKSKEL